MHTYCTAQCAINFYWYVLNFIVILLYSLQRRINNHSDNEQFLLSSRGHAAGVGTRRSSNRFLSESEVWKRYSTIISINEQTELKWETALSPCMTVQHYMIYLRIVRNYGSSKNLNVKWCRRPDFIVSIGFQQCRWVSTSLGLKLSRPTLRKPSPSLSEESGDVSSWAAPPSTKKIWHNLDIVEFAGGLKIEVIKNYKHLVKFNSHISRCSICYKIYKFHCISGCNFKVFQPHRPQQLKPFDRG